MLIEEDFFQFQHRLAACALVDFFNVHYDKRGTHEGFIRGEIHFHDGSTLRLREFVEAEPTAERLRYVYHYVTTSQQLIFRYDDTGHHRKLNLTTYPHHKHIGREEHVVASVMPTFSEILKEIEGLIES